jgi:hypothetical protein
MVEAYPLSGCPALGAAHSLYPYSACPLQLGAVRDAPHDIEDWVPGEYLENRRLTGRKLAKALSDYLDVADESRVSGLCGGVELAEQGGWE